MQHIIAHVKEFVILPESGFHSDSLNIPISPLCFDFHRSYLMPVQRNLRHILVEECVMRPVFCMELIIEIRRRSKPIICCLPEIFE